jgi:hypothetical protein
MTDSVMFPAQHTVTDWGSRMTKDENGRWVTYRELARRYRAETRPRPWVPSEEELRLKEARDWKSELRP